jgi:hypothetical protein
MKQVRLVQSQSLAEQLVQVLVGLGYRAWFNHMESDGAVFVYFVPFQIQIPAEVN